MLLKKCLTICIIIMLLSFSLQNISYGAIEGTGPSTYEDMTNNTTEKSVKDMYDESKVTVLDDDEVYITSTEHSGAGTATPLSSVLTLLPYVVSNLMTVTVKTGNNRMYSTTPIGVFTIENLVFDRIEIFNANYFVENANEANYSIKKNVKDWYSATRLIAIAASLVTLIYMGIRMGISTIASDKAKYKRMLLDWVIGFGAIFVLHIAIILLSNLSTSMSYVIAQGADEITLEANIMEYNFSQIKAKTGWESVTQTAIYFVLVFYQLRFFLMYMKRFFMVGFLIVIAPLMSITYAIDRAADKKSQIFNSWLKELSVNLFIQPLHALLYLVFMYSAGEIAEVAPIFAILFLMALSRGEKIVKGIFNLRGMQTINSMSETLQAKQLKGE